MPGEDLIRRTFWVAGERLLKIPFLTRIFLCRRTKKPLSLCGWSVQLWGLANTCNTVRWNHWLRILAANGSSTVFFQWVNEMVKNPIDSSPQLTLKSSRNWTSESRSVQNLYLKAAAFRHCRWGLLLVKEPLFQGSPHHFNFFPYLHPFFGRRQSMYETQNDWTN